MRLHFCLLLIVAAAATIFPAAQAAPAPTSNLDSGWRLWLDRDAKWRDDTLYLPDEVNLLKLPVNPPSGGWKSLSDTAGISVSLPDTVEAHQLTPPPPGDANAIINARPSYEGVSWWYRPFTAPALRPGERLVFSFRGARLRSEVYVNGQLCGYNIITEAPFSADATRALRPGVNQLAVRITNPGGNVDWMDFLTFQWGQYTLPISHSFGGIDGGVQMQVRGPVSVSDLAVFNTPNVRTVKLQAEVTSTGLAYSGPVALSIQKSGKTLWSGAAAVRVPANGTATVSTEASVPAALLWDVGRPQLYSAVASLGEIPNSDKRTVFGFRWFAPEGVGTNAYLTLNGRRIVPRSSISWGFWAPNGMFPDQAAANREVAAMRALGLDSIQNHRHMPKPIVLDTFDREGMLRYCEPGAGMFTFTTQLSETKSTQGPVDTSGAGGEASTFTERYERAKVLAMIRENRSHPSVTIWTLQNEISPDLHNPKLWNVLRAMRAADPSRPVLLKSGIFTQNQVWSLPYSSEWSYDNGQGVSGWWDYHTAVSSAGVYQDSMYRSPQDFLYRSDNTKEVVVWGEMATGASPDNHAADVAWYQKAGKTGYDLAAHRALLGAYNQFLDEFHFRSAFPTAEALFQSAGNKHYFSAGRILEQARMSDANDYIVLSGWESTTLENHSGLTDSLRLLKGDPAPLKRASTPALLVVRPRQSVVAPGDKVTLDVHLINEINLNGAYQLNVSATMSSPALANPALANPASTQTNTPFFQTSFPVSVVGENTFGQLLRDNIQFTPAHAGPIQVTATLAAEGNSKPVLTRTEEMLAINPQPAPLVGPVAFAGTSAAVGQAMQTQFKLDVLPFAASNPPLKTLVLSSEGSGLPNGWQSFSDNNLPIENTDEPNLYREQLFGPPGEVLTLRGLAPGTVKVELFLAENYQTEAGKRLFDVALNGQTVLKDFDIFRESGGKGRALIKSFEAFIVEGSLTLTIPRVAADKASLAALRVTDAAGNVQRRVFHERNYTDKAGNVWKSAAAGDFDWETALPPALSRVHNDGTRLVLLTAGGDDARIVADFLGRQNLFSFGGMVGDPGPSWLGFWYFGRNHWLLDGLPSNGVLDWPYGVSSGNGMILHGPNVEGVIGYGRNHDARLGLGAAVISHGKGQIVLLALPGLSNAFTSGGDQFQPVTAKRLLYNALTGGMTQDIASTH
ncbi:MAG: malectin domain-containing carbohydrate-binding protein [Armatimonadota bacterium]|nr:malectin domain-containing carbohydrate-binding protein [Armatimonadota bacterium]